MAIRQRQKERRNDKYATTRRHPARAPIGAVVGSWPDVEVGAHRFGGVEFRLGRRELGHLHGDSHADIAFPRKVRDELVAAGRALPHRAIPDSGWISAPIDDGEGVERAIELFRMAYDRARAAKLGRRAPGEEACMSMHTITPHVVVRDAARAVDWYTNVLGAEERLRIPVPDGRLMSVELRFGDSTVMLADEFPEMGIVSPQTLGGTYMALHLMVEDVEGSGGGRSTRAQRCSIPSRTASGASDTARSSTRSATAGVWPSICATSPASWYAQPARCLPP